MGLVVLVLSRETFVTNCRDMPLLLALAGSWAKAGTASPEVTTKVSLIRHLI